MQLEVYLNHETIIKISLNIYAKIKRILKKIETLRLLSFLIRNRNIEVYSYFLRQVNTHRIMNSSFYE